MLNKALIWALMVPICADASSVRKVGEPVVGKCSWFQADKSSAINPNPPEHYVACRFDYKALSKDLKCKRKEVKSLLKDMVVEVTNIANGKTLFASVADWGPHRRTGRAIDLSKKLLDDLDLRTDDHVKFVLRKKNLDTQTRRVVRLESHR